MAKKKKKGKVGGWGEGGEEKTEGRKGRREIFLNFIHPRNLKSVTNPAAMKISNTGILVSTYHFPLKNKTKQTKTTTQTQGLLEKQLIQGLGQEMYKITFTQHQGRLIATKSSLKEW